MKLRYKLLSGAVIVGVLYIIYCSNTKKKKESCIDSEAKCPIFSDSQSKKLETPLSDKIMADSDSSISTAENNLETKMITDCSHERVSESIDELLPPISLEEIEEEKYESYENSPTTEELVEEVQTLGSYSHMTIQELKDYAKSHGIKGISRMNKQKLVEHIVQTEETT